MAADYYILREAWIAAVNRAQNVIKYYQNSPVRNRALDIMIMAYDKLGMTKLADDARQIRAMNPVTDTNSLSSLQTKEILQNKTPATPVIAKAAK